MGHYVVHIQIKVGDSDCKDLLTPHPLPHHCDQLISLHVSYARDPCSRYQSQIVCLALEQEDIVLKTCGLVFKLVLVMSELALDLRTLLTQLTL